MTLWSYAVYDNSKKTKGSQMHISELAGDNAGNVLYTDIDDLESTLADITNANIISSRLSVKRATGLKVPPVGVDVQNEIVLAVSFQDTVTLKFGSFSIPAPDPTMRLTNTDVVDVTNQKWIDAVAVWEAAGRSDIGNPISIVSGTFEGRSN